MREQYEEFQAGRSQVQDQSELLNISVKVHAKYNFNEFVPRLEYTPTFEYVDPLYVSSFVDYNPIPTNVYFDVAYPFFVAQAPMIFVGGMQLSYIFPEPPFPGSLAFVLKQTNVLLDNDFIDMTGLYSGFQPNPDDENQLEYLKDQAELLAPISPLDEPNSEEAIASLIEQVAAEIQSYNSNYQAQDGASASFGVDVFGTHVNGDTTIEAPTLSDKMPDSLKSEEVESAEDDQMHLPDQVVISSTWSAAAVVAVDGDVHTVNAISQINVWNDTDSIGGLFSNNGSASTATQAYNIASVSVTANPRIDLC
ncbi:hypothetical protein GQR58_005223 [Nymphon striatum]|nr:hypothetical protein GQR58_005223 [Nymphon striatum]